MRMNASDRLALSDLVHLYASAVDDRRFDDVIELFTETAELRLPDPPRALEPVRRLGEVYAEGPHHDYALGRVTFIAHHWTVEDGRVTDVVWHLRYDDEYSRTRAGWRIHGRALTINAIETRPIRLLRAHPTSGRAAAADPSTASTEPARSETSQRDRPRGTP